MTDYESFDCFLDQTPEEREIGINYHLGQKDFSLDDNEDNLSSITTNTDERNVGKVSRSSKKVQKPRGAQENKKEKNKGREKLSLEEKIAMSEAFRTSPELNDPNIDQQTKKKIMQMIRNRISAQTSRDRKKLMAAKMENEINQVRMENVQLRQKIFELEQKLVQSASGILCPACLEAQNPENGERLAPRAFEEIDQSPFVFEDEGAFDPIQEENDFRNTGDADPFEMDLVRRESTDYGRNSPYMQNTLFLVVLFSCIMLFSGLSGWSSGETGFEQGAPSLSQGLVPVFGPKINGNFHRKLKIKR